MPGAADDYGMGDRFPYSPASQFPGSDSHVELHGPAHGSDHNSNGIDLVGPSTSTDVMSHAGPADRPPFTDPESW